MPAAAGATGSPRSARDTRLPFMVISLGALPPYLLVATRSNIVWAQIPVLGRMPLDGEFGMGDRQAFLGPFCLLQRCCHTPTSMESTYLEIIVYPGIRVVSLKY